MATLIFANNAASTLSGGITNTSTQLVVAAGGGALFPNPAPGQYFVSTIIDAATGLIREIIWVTARQGDVFTIVRAQEGTTAFNWQPNDLIQELWTAGQAAQMMQQGQAPSSIVYYGVDYSATVNNIVANMTPTLAGMVTGTIFEVSVAQGNTQSAVWFAPSGFGPWNVWRADGSPLLVGDIQGPPYKALMGWDGATGKFLLFNPCLWAEGSGLSAPQWTNVWRNTNVVEQAYNEIIHITNTNGVTNVVQLLTAQGVAWSYIISNQSGVGQNVTSTGSNFYDTDMVINSGTALGIPTGCVVMVTADGGNWLVTNVSRTADTSLRGESREADPINETQFGKTLYSTPAFATPEGVDAHFFYHVADTGARGISREATSAEAIAGVTSGSVPAFITPEDLAAALANNNPFNSLAVGAVIIYSCISAGGGGGAQLNTPPLVGTNGTLSYIHGGTAGGNLYALVTYTGWNVGAFQDHRFPNPAQQGTPYPVAGTWTVITANASNVTIMRTS